MPQPPFDESLDAILRSSDGLDFPVHRAVLALASPFFKDLFSLPQPESEPKVPVIPVAESSLILQKLLGTWYPGAEAVVAFDGIEQLAEIVELAMSKYEFRFVGPIMRRYLQDYLDTDAVAVYAVACRYHWKDLARKAARHSLKLSLPSILRLNATPQLRNISADLYRALLLYHHKCSAVAGSFGTALVSSKSGWAWMACNSCRCWVEPKRVVTFIPRTQTAVASASPLLPMVSPRAWIIDYIDRAKAALKEAPGATVSDIVFLAPTLTKLASCDSICATSGVKDLANFISGEYLPKLNQALDNVPLELGF
ncbi:hypothetical protein C8F04DRAFT_1134572 [Mycena alexandri]|uniref:BTB domain-containing protein n=1 Tax=Mycena alexandri TaxID=1745969 RepID=A0AAD6WW47_9AGAR|nr:hypothetical protein C8F04DRAFT_1134572 [Mycena alexandri]